MDVIYSYTGLFFMPTMTLRSKDGNDAVMALQKLGLEEVLQRT